MENLATAVLDVRKICIPKAFEKILRRGAHQHKEPQLAQLQAGRVRYGSVTVCLPCSVLLLDQLLLLPAVGVMVLDWMEYPPLCLETVLLINIMIQILEELNR